MKVLTVAFLGDAHTPQFGDNKGKQYKVLQVEQTTEYAPNQYMTKTEVQELCDLPKQYKVVIKAMKP